MKIIFVQQFKSLDLKCVIGVLKTINHQCLVRQGVLWVNLHNTRQACNADVFKVVRF